MRRTRVYVKSINSIFQIDLIYECFAAMEATAEGMMAVNPRRWRLTETVVGILDQADDLAALVDLEIEPLVVAFFR